MGNRPRIFFLTYSGLPILPPSEINIINHLKDDGYTVSIVNWDKWNLNEYQSEDIIFLRSTWNYDEKPIQFKAFLQDLKNRKAIVFNSIDLMLWNMNKSYMFEFQTAGLSVLPTYKPSQKSLLINEHPICSTIIAKPVFSAGARGLLKLSKEEWLSNDLPEAEYICQPFAQSVVDSGEWSLLYFDGVYSHSVLKKAKKGDFRVQSDHGGTVEFVSVSEDWVELGKSFLNACQTVPFFARVDLVLWDSKPVLIELEIIEPELFVTEEQANLNYRNAIHSKIESLVL